MKNELQGYCVVVVNGKEVRRQPAVYKTSMHENGKGLKITLYSDLVFQDIPPGFCELWASPSLRGPLQVLLSKSIKVDHSHTLVINAKTDFDNKGQLLLH